MLVRNITILDFLGFIERSYLYQNVFHDNIGSLDQVPQSSKKFENSSKLQLAHSILWVGSLSKKRQLCIKLIFGNEAQLTQLFNENIQNHENLSHCSVFCLKKLIHSVRRKWFSFKDKRRIFQRNSRNC